MNHHPKLLPIAEVAAQLDIPEDALDLYGKYKAKVDETRIPGLDERQDGRLILVTAMSPTPAGEGKTTVCIGLGDGLRRIGKRAAIALREPSMGPVFGLKGGATGGGRAQVEPMDEINLHFTGDFHAIGAANNLLAALLDNHLQHGNELGIDPRRIIWKRTVDMNDRQLRFIVSGLGGRTNGLPREDGFQITVASEIMAILCLSRDLTDLKSRLGRIIVGYTYEGEPVTAADLKATGAMAALLKEALKPNLAQTLEHTPAFIHGGPFANIAHGSNSLKATKLALKCADYVVTEAGFGSDLGAEKFLDIKCRLNGLCPDAVVLVATIRALKWHGGLGKDERTQPDWRALEAGWSNLEKHIRNMKEVFSLPVVVAINQFLADRPEELDWVKKRCMDMGVPCVVANPWEKGGEGTQELAEAVCRLAEGEKHLSYPYDLEDPILEKMEKLTRTIYGGEGVTLTASAKKDIDWLETHGFRKLPICMAKTQYSLSDDPAKIGRPEGFRITVREVKPSAGAGFLVAYTGSILTMPGLPKKPAAERIDVDESGQITGLF